MWTVVQRRTLFLFGKEAARAELEDWWSVGVLGIAGGAGIVPGSGAVGGVSGGLVGGSAR